MIDALLAMNTLLLALDGKSSRAYAYTCGNTVAGGHSVVDPLKLDVHLVPSCTVRAGCACRPCGSAGLGDRAGHW